MSKKPNRPISLEAILLVLFSSVFLLIVLGISVDHYTEDARQKREEESKVAFEQMLERQAERQRQAVAENFESAKSAYEGAIARYAQVFGELPPDTFTPDDYDRLVRPPIPQQPIETGAVVSIVQR